MLTPRQVHRFARLKELSVPARLLGLVIASAQQMRLTHQQLSEMAGVSLRSVGGYLRELEGAGRLKVQHHVRASTYMVMLDDPEEMKRRATEKLTRIEHTRFKAEIAARVEQTCRVFRDRAGRAA